MKNTKQAESIDQYIGNFPKDTQTTLLKLRQVVKTAAPKSEETIKYAIPTFVLDGKNLVHFAAFKKHIGFYPTPSPINAFKKELSKYKVSKGAIQFPLDKPIPYTLIKKIVRHRVKTILS